MVNQVPWTLSGLVRFYRTEPDDWEHNSFTDWFQKHTTSSVF